MHFTTEAIVLREKPIDEYDSLLTLLCRDLGVLSVYARGAKKPRSPMRAAVELLSYSCFVVFRARERFSVDKADSLRLFMGIRGDLEKLSLASYMCELMQELAPKGQPAEDYVSLMLNCLHLLDGGKRTCAFLKPLFELRLTAMAGFMPDLVGCAGCGQFEAAQMHFLPGSGILWCGDCAARALPKERMVPLSPGVLAAMRHILYADSKKLYAFTLPERGLLELDALTQGFLLQRLERKLDTLSFYESIRIGPSIAP